MTKLLVAMTAFLSIPSIAAEWKVESKSDPLTDETRVTATLVIPSTVAGRGKGAVVRCIDKKFEVFVDFGDYLNNGLVSVRYRVDKNPMIEERWLPSADGTAAFASNDADLARKLMNGDSLIVEATDFRGVPHRVSLEWSDARKAIEPVLRACGVATEGMDSLVPGLRAEIATHLEKWGPKTTSTSKRILAARDVYSGPIDTTIEPEFALAVQVTYDDWIEQCRAKKVSGAQCTSLHIFWSNNREPVMPLPVSVIYEISTGALKREAGSLKINE